MIPFTALSEKALLWFEGDFCHKILSMGEAVAVEEKSFQDMLLRELMSEGIIRYQVPQVIGGRVQNLEIIKRGPVVFMVTTTKAALRRTKPGCFRSKWTTAKSKRAAF